MARLRSVVVRSLNFLLHVDRSPRNCRASNGRRADGIVRFTGHASFFNDTRLKGNYADVVEPKVIKFIGAYKAACRAYTSLFRH